jgi:hypothetical protein
VVALVMYVFVRPIEVSSAERDEAIRVFLDAVRRDDGAALGAVTAPGFAADAGFLRDHVRTSVRYEQGNSNISRGDDESCVRGMLFPARVRIVMRLRKQRDRWLLESAATADPCERGLRF